MPKRHYNISDFSGGMVTTQPGSDLQPNQYMFGYDIDPSYPGGLRGRKVDLDIKISGIAGTPLKAIRAELDVICQVLQTSSGVYQITDSVGVAPSPQALVSSSGAMQANNRAVHIGTGSGTEAKWYGMVNHQQFGVPAPAGIQFESSALLPPGQIQNKSFGLGSKGCSDGTGMVYLDTSGKRLFRFSTTLFDKASRSIFQNATAICSNPEGSGTVLVYDSGSNRLITVSTATMEVLNETSISPSIANDGYIVMDMETTANDVYFLVSNVGGFTKEEKFIGANGEYTESVGYLWKMPKSAIGASASVTDVTPQFYSSPDAEARFEAGSYDQGTGSPYVYSAAYLPFRSLDSYSIKISVFRKSLFRISSSLMGLYARHNFSGTFSLTAGTQEVFSVPINSTFHMRNLLVGGGYITKNMANDGCSFFVISGEPRSSESTNYNLTNTVPNTSTAPQSNVWLSYESGSVHRGYFSLATKQNSFDSCSVNLTSAYTVTTSSFSGATNISTSLVKSAAMVRFSSVYYLLNGDGTMNPSGRYANGAGSALDANLGVLNIEQEDNGFTEENTSYYYKISYLYDGFQESPMSSGDVYHSPNPGKKIKLKIYLPANTNRRVSHINIYRSQTGGSYGFGQSFYQLVETISLSPSFTNGSASFGPINVSGKLIEYTDNLSLNQLGPTYESNSGLPETLSTSTVQYGLSAQINGYHFVADCSHSVISNASQYIFRSVQGQFDNFNYLSNVLRLPERPIELATFRSRLYAFTKNRIWRIEPNGFYIEDEMEGYGIANKGAVVVTEFGMFFAGPSGIYYTDGSTPQDISFPVNRNYSNETFGLLDPAYLNRTSDNVILNYDPRNRLVLVFYRPAGSTSYRILAYSIDQRRWDHWDGTAFGAATGAPCSLSTGIPTMVSGAKVIAVAAGVTDKTVTYYGPWLDMQEPGTEKWFYEVKIQYRDAAIRFIDPSNFGSILVEIDDEGIVSLTSVAVLEEGTAMPSTGKDAIYKYPIPKSGANYRSGKRIRLAFTAPTPCKIDSYSIIYRPKEFKGAK